MQVLKARVRDAVMAISRSILRTTTQLVFPIKAWKWGRFFHLRKPRMARNTEASLAASDLL